MPRHKLTAEESALANQAKAKKFERVKRFTVERWTFALQEHNRIALEERTPPLGTPLEELIRAAEKENGNG